MSTEDTSDYAEDAAVLARKFIQEALPAALGALLIEKGIITDAEIQQQLRAIFAAGAPLIASAATEAGAEADALVAALHVELEKLLQQNVWS